MFWQPKYVRENIAMTVGGDYELDLPENGLLGSMLILLSGNQASGYGQSGGDWRIIDEIDLVEVLLESTHKAKSLTGYQAQAIATMDQGLLSLGSWRNYATNSQWELMLLNFGRHLYDSEYGLDLSKWNNVKLLLSNTAGSSDFGNLSISVLGIFLRDAPAGSFKGYIKSEQWRSWTTVANETIYNSLPTELKLRRILLQCIPAVDGSNVEKTNMWNLAQTVKLSLDTGGVLVYEGGIDEIMRLNAYAHGKPLIFGAYPYHNADKGIDISLGYVTGAVLGSGSQDGAVAGTNATLESGRTSFTQKMETYEGDSPGCLMGTGFAPYMTVQFPFDINPEPETWLDPERRKTVQLDVTTRNHSDAASGTNAIILERLART